MKNSIFKTSLVAFLVVMCISCGSDNEPGTPISNNDTFLTAKVDGVDFEVRGNLFAVESNIGGVNSTQLLAGYDDDSRTIAMGIANLDGTGTYSLLEAPTQDPLTTKYASSMIYGEGNTSWLAIVQLDNVKVTISITEFNDSYVEGTFNFIGFDVNSETEKNVTNGSFRFKRLKVN